MKEKEETALSQPVLKKQYNSDLSNTSLDFCPSPDSSFDTTDFIP
jgi:hypothetical protein